MSIRWRLVSSYAAMMVVPGVLLLLSLMLLILFSIGDIAKIGKYYGVEFDENMIEDYVTQRTLLYNDLKHSALVQPEKLLSPDYVSENEPLLERMRTGIAVEKGGELLYQSPGLETGSLAASNGRYYASDGTAYGLTTYRLAFSDRTEGTLQVFSDLTPIYRFADRFPPVLIAALLLAFLIPGGLLTFWISRSMIAPLRELQTAAERIKDGDLEFSLQIRRKDEIGHLSKAFEEMRIRLKQSIDLQLKEEENRRELLSNISHDLRTPITAIKGYVEGILDGVADDSAKMEKYLRTIHTKAADLGSLIDELFLYSKLDLNHMPFEFETIPLLPFLQDCAEECALDLQKHGIELIWESAGLPNSLSIHADRDKLKRALLNMIENSKKFADKSPAYVRIRAEAAREQVSIVLEDNGVGIDKDSLPFIFDRLYRVDPARTSALGGSGLGLAIAKQIVAAHDGTIQADSRLGAGTTMTITLPIRQPERSEAV